MSPFGGFLFENIFQKSLNSQHHVAIRHISTSQGITMNNEVTMNIEFNAPAGAERFRFTDVFQFPTGVWVAYHPHTKQTFTVDNLQDLPAAVWAYSSQLTAYVQANEERLIEAGFKVHAQFGRIYAGTGEDVTDATVALMRAMEAK
jgi:hypothetical protein